MSAFTSASFLGSDAGGKSAGWPVKKAVWVEQEGNSTLPPVPDRPERGQSSVQRVRSDECRLPQLHGGYLIHAKAEYNILSSVRAN